MKRIFILSLLIFSNIILNAQVIKEIDNGISVSFPNDPTYTFAKGYSVFLSNTDYATVSASVKRNALPYYDKFIVESKKWEKGKKEEIIDYWLDMFVKGATEERGIVAKVGKIRQGEFQGRTMEYKEFNSAIGKTTKRYSIVYFVRGSSVFFDYFLNGEETEESLNEKKLFFNSITIK